MTIFNRLHNAGLQLPMGRVHGTHERPVLIDVRPGNSTMGVLSGETWRDEHGILFLYDATAEVKIQHVLTDYVLLGWLATRSRKVNDAPHAHSRWSNSNQEWQIMEYATRIGRGRTEVEAWLKSIEGASQ